MSDRINPPYYRRLGMEVADIIAAWGLSYNLGVALAYILRAGKKTPDPTDDLKKVLWHIEDELKRIGERQGQEDSSADARMAKKVAEPVFMKGRSVGIDEALERHVNGGGK